MVTIYSTETASSYFNPNSDRVKVKPSGGIVLGGTSMEERVKL